MLLLCGVRLAGVRAGQGLSAPVGSKGWWATNHLKRMCVCVCARARNNYHDTQQPRAPARLCGHVHATMTMTRNNDDLKHMCMRVCVCAHVHATTTTTMTTSSMCVCVCVRALQDHCLSVRPSMAATPGAVGTCLANIVSGVSLWLRAFLCPPCALAACSVPVVHTFAACSVPTGCPVLTRRLLAHHSAFPATVLPWHTYGLAHTCFCPRTRMRLLTSPPAAGVHEPPCCPRHHT